MPPMLGTLKVTYSDGTSVEGPTRNSDAIRFERQFKMPVSRIFNRTGPNPDDLELYMEHLWYFGWCVASRDGEEQPYGDEWLDRVESVDVVKQAKPVPTKPSRTRSQ